MQLLLTRRRICCRRVSARKLFATWFNIRIIFEAALGLILGNIKMRIDDLWYGLNFGAQFLFDFVECESLFNKKWFKMKKIYIKVLFYLSSYVMRLMAMPKWPKRPDLPIRCKYVSDIFGKSKLITTLTAWMSMPLVNRSFLKLNKEE